MTKNEMLNQKVCDKMQAELDEFIAELKTKSSSEIIECAYELIYKEDFLQSFDFAIDKQIEHLKSRAERERECR